ncbi:MAG: T9SS type A sorting domain-containing protein [Bacteroidia bacterium]
MKTNFVLIAILICTFASNSFSQTPGWQWGRNAIGNDYDQGDAAATDLNGNVIVAGYYASDTLIFANDTLINSGIGNDEIYVAKYDSSGNVLWALSAGGSGDDKASAVATDASGNIYVTGYYYSPAITFGTYTLTNAGVVGDIFIVKYDAQGNVLWAKGEGGTALEIPYSIVVDGANNFIVTGRFSSSTITFGTTTLTLAGANDIFIVKYDAAGNVLWAKGAGSGSIDEGFSVGVDAINNVYVTGHFNQNCNFGPYVLTTAGQSDIFLAKYDASGNILWAKRFGGNGDDRANALKVDANGNCYLAGFFKSISVAFGADTLASFFAAGVTNALVFKTDSGGNALWAQAVNGKSTAYAIAITPNNVYTCGGFSDDSLNYGNYTLLYNGSSDFFLLHCDTSGNSKWTINQTSEGGSSESANAIAADQWGNIFIAGEFGSHDPLVFGNDTLNPTDNSFDMFVARLGSIATEIHDLQNENETIIYPNPSNGKFILKSKANINAFRIYDVNGRVVMEQFANQQIFQIDISELKSGIYFVQVQTKDGMSNAKIIKQ